MHMIQLHRSAMFLLTRVPSSKLSMMEFTQFKTLEHQVSIFYFFTYALFQDAVCSSDIISTGSHQLIRNGKDVEWSSCSTNWVTNPAFVSRDRKKPQKNTRIRRAGFQVKISTTALSNTKQKWHSLVLNIRP
jgi:hypothetical protein